MEFQKIINFWFNELTPADHFKKSEKLDAMIRERFSQVWEQAIKGELFMWRSSDLGRLAEILVLDQFSRNIHRESALAFAGDPIALTLAQEAVLQKTDQRLETRQRLFLYMPYMHSESVRVHEEALKLFAVAGLEENLKYEVAHLEILKKFGRYPHRNKILGRVSTTEELEFLKLPGSSF